MPETHSRPVAGGRGVWYTERLWELSRDLPVRMVRIEDIKEFEQNCWFGESSPPTCRAVAEHARRMWNADLSYPVILAADGGLMDGGHRIGKAWLAGMSEIKAVQFEVDPEPDYLIGDR